LKPMVYISAKLEFKNLIEYWGVGSFLVELFYWVATLE
jgi:hypothetical protein